MYQHSIEHRRSVPPATGVRIGVLHVTQYRNRNSLYTHSLLLFYFLLSKLVKECVTCNKQGFESRIYGVTELLQNPECYTINSDLL